MSGVPPKVRQYSIELGKAPHAPTERLIVVPFAGDLTAGFRRAGALTGQRVRLVGHGVTCKAEWEPYANHPGLILTELGAYRTHSFTEPTAPLRRAVREWADKVFKFDFGLEGGEVVSPMASVRVMLSTMNMRGTAEG